MRKRLFPILMMLTFLLSGAGVTVAHAAPHMPDVAPEDTTQALVGFDAPTFHSTQYAFLTPQGVEELYTKDGQNWADNNITAIATGAPLPSSQHPGDLAGLYDAHLNEKQYVYFAGNGDLIELFVHPSGAGWSFENISASAGIGGKTGSQFASGLTGIASAGTNTVEYLWDGPNGEVFEVFSLDGTHWTFSDLADQHLPDNGLGYTAFDAPEFAPHETEFGYTVSGDVIEADSLDSQHWSPADLTVNAQAPAGSVINNDGAVVGFASSQFNSKQFAYLTEGSNGLDIEELYVSPHGTWQHANLSVLASAPPANEGTPLVGFDSPQFHSKQYAYMTVDSQDHRIIEELSITAGGSWQAASPSIPVCRCSTPPSASGIGFIGFDSPTFGTRQYAYLTPQGDIEQLSLSTQPGSIWQPRDLTIAALP